ncbi:unnamed protein product [Cylindrotheca closterium]|uniref:Transcriptional regulator ATRX n=1 Tax=Cylindrotheca closterium TaxID=2856 RepID=A0AAD2G3X2_9STRA|nr:unnamed protein product [Cylindrotheca closterium]
MATDPEVIDLCSSSSEEDENDAAPTVATKQRIPTGPSVRQTPTDAPGHHQSLPSPISKAIRNSTTTTSNGGSAVTAKDIANTKPHWNTFSNRQNGSERATVEPSSAHSQISPDEQQSAIPSELLQEKIARNKDFFNDSDDEEINPFGSALEQVKIDFFKEHCFACQVPLCNPFQRNVERSCYALHSHPNLRVPVCVVCSDEIANLELTKHEAEEEDNEICGLCGSNAEKMFLCDGSECRASRSSICDQCVQNANPTLDLEELEASDQDWYCPCCKPPNVISQLRNYLEELQTRQQSSTGSKETRIESLLEDLQLVESKKAECEEALDDQESYNIEIELELTRSTGFASCKNIKDQVQGEFDLWLEAQHKHHARLVDMITVLHEALEQEGLDLKEHYFKEDTADRNNSEAAEVEDWKIQADMEIAKRAMDEGLKTSLTPPPPPTRDEEKEKEELALKEIDDLGSISESSDVDMVNPWRQAPYRVPDWKIQEAMEAEDEEFAAAKRKLRIVSEKDDANAAVTESKISAGVRKEASIVVHKCQRRRRKAYRGQRRRRKEARKRRRSTDASSGKVNVSTVASSLSKTPSGNGSIRPKQNKRKAVTKGLLPLSDSESSSEEENHQLEPKKQGFGHLFENSDFILTTDPHQDPIQVAEELAKILKPHQKEGIQFIFQNTFHDIAFPKDKLTEDIEEKVGGCILAHNMGLGKSLCCVTLLHTLFFHPSLQNDVGQPKIRFAILVAPVNTIRNWENELGKWTEKLGTHIDVHCVSSGGHHKQVIRTWAKTGGVLLMSDALFRNNVKVSKEELQDLADVIFLDEAHTMLKNKSNAVFKALMGVKTARRICLTGSPFQNNLFEYFRMASYIRPGVLGNSERVFEKKYVVPIQEGVSTDATGEAKKKADESMNEIQGILEPYVHRKDAGVLLEELPPMQQVVLHTRQTKLQRRLNGAYKRFQKSSDKDVNNFLHMYNSLRTVHNHPGTLLFRQTKTRPKEKKTTDSMPVLATTLNNDAKSGNTSSSTGLDNGPTTNVNELEIPKMVIKIEPMDSSSIHQPMEMAEKKDPDDISIIELLSDSEEEEPEPDEEVPSEIETTPQRWWSSVANKINNDEMRKIENGNKIVLLLHILTHAYQLNEKVVLFSQCLKTLDYISSVLAINDWGKQVPSLGDAFPGVSIGGWELGKQFLRIDGTTSANDRGNRIDRFEEDSIRLFLISSRAGGIGINLCSANRVVIFDSHFNPTIDLQALYRCYRYGQQRSVFAYRFLTEGTIEGKVYSRAVNKASLGLSLVDGKSFQRLFSAKETEDFAKTDSWACCNRCEKWRMFPPQENVDVTSLPDKWYCEEMNDVDKSTKIDCTFPERDEIWYWNHYGLSNETKENKSTTGPIVAMSGSAKALSDDTKEALVARDEILKGLLNVTGGKKSIVSRYYFHDALIDQDNAKKAGSESEDRSPQRMDQDAMTEGVGLSEQADAKKAKHAVELQSSPPIGQDSISKRSKPNDQKTAPGSTPRTKERNSSEATPNKKRSSPRSSKTSNSKRQKRKVVFSSLWSGFDSDS